MLKNWGLKEKAREKLGWGKNSSSSSSRPQSESGLSVTQASGSLSAEEGSSLQSLELAVTSELNRSGDGPDEASRNGHRGRSKTERQQPTGTIQYRVTSTDTLEKVAARCDCTPTELAKLNRLSLRTIFPDQTIYIPDPDFVPEPVPPSSAPAAVSPSSPVEQASPTRGPGRAHRLSSDPQGSPQSPYGSPRHGSPRLTRPLSEEQARQLDEECLERFLKLEAKYITDGQGVVSGILLVTPNAVMFDPSVSDPLVLERGADKYGMIAPMDMLVSAALYRDIAVMKLKGQEDLEHAADCSIYRPVSDSSVQPDDSSTDVTSQPAPKRRVRQDSLCSCGASSASLNHTPVTAPSVPTNTPQRPSSPVRQPETVQTDARTEQGLADTRTEQGLADTRKAGEEQTVDSVSGDKLSESPHSGWVQVEIPAQITPAVPIKSDTTTEQSPAGSGGSGGERPVFVTGSPHSGSASPASRRLETPSPSLVDSSDMHHFSSSPHQPVTRASSSPKSVKELMGQSSGVTQLARQLSDSAASIRNKARIHVESVIRPEEKPSLFQDIDKLVPRPSSLHEEPPMFLCVRLGMPKDGHVSHSCPIEQYAANRKRAEYWFSVPRNMVDRLYAFFLHWKPDTYAADPVSVAEQKGFVLLSDDEEEQEEAREVVSSLPHETKVKRKLSRSFSRDWELISADEFRRRQSIAEAEEKSELPLPELVGGTTMLTETQLRQMVMRLPYRVEGYDWRLIYSTEQHGFSLSTLYRHMVTVDSPVTLIIQDTNHCIFGALLSESIKMSDHFYGQGESYLFSFKDNCYQHYKWSGDNNFFMKGDTSCFSIGSGSGRAGMWLDSNLYHGYSAHCETFNNEILASKQDFVIKSLEAWSFICD